MRGCALVSNNLGRMRNSDFAPDTQIWVISVEFLQWFFRPLFIVKPVAVLQNFSFFPLAMLLAIYENEWRKFQEKNLAPLSKKIIAIGTMAPST